jgi:phosphoglycerate kinase
MLPYLRVDDDSLDLTGKTLIMRVDFNSPVDTGQTPPILKGTKRIDDHISTSIVPLLNRQNPPRNIVLLAHQGRRGQPDFITLRPHFEHCRSVLQQHQIKTFYVWEEFDDQEVLEKGPGAVASEPVLDRIRRLRERTVLVLENVRFAEEEMGNSGSPHDFVSSPLIQMLSAVDNVVVAIDGFSVAHRAQSSVVGLANLGPLFAGPVMLREMKQLSQALLRPEPPMLLIVGGAKVDDSLRSTERFLTNGMAHEVLTGGLVGMLFLLATGVQLNAPTITNLRNSTADLDRACKFAQKLLAEHGRGQIKVPVDVAYAPRQGFPGDRRTEPVSSSELSKIRFEIGDIGIETVAQFNYEIAKARTVVMNGPMGRYESKCFALGTHEILRYVGLVAHDRGAHALVGGGDTGAALGSLERDYASHVLECSSGKAFLQVLASGDLESLPGVRALAR